jgi:hypothetical protein
MTATTSLNHFMTKAIGHPSSASCYMAVTDVYYIVVSRARRCVPLFTGVQNVEPAPGNSKTSGSVRMRTPAQRKTPRVAEVQRFNGRSNHTIDI